MIIITWGLLLGTCWFISSVAKRKGQAPIIWFFISLVLLFICTLVAKVVIAGADTLPGEMTALLRWFLRNTSMSHSQIVPIEYCLYAVIGIVVGAIPLLIYLNSKTTPKETQKA